LLGGSNGDKYRSFRGASRDRRPVAECQYAMWRPGRVRRRTGERSRKGGSREVVDEGVGRPRTRRGRQRLEPEEGITHFPYGTIGDPSHKHRAFNSVLIAERTCVGKKTFLTVPYSGVRIEGLKLAAINRRSTCSGQDRLCLSIFLRIKMQVLKTNLQPAGHHAGLSVSFCGRIQMRSLLLPNWKNSQCSSLLLTPLSSLSKKTP
jgi:hypothetical protein